jgi:2-polyprenyl-6-hydroxyphenyl methylase/3-demethylubiquinone-9 3-methyltransferase
VIARKTKKNLCMIKLVLVVGVFATVIILMKPPPEYTDRNVKLPESKFVIDNDFYDDNTFAINWWNTNHTDKNAWAIPLHHMNPVRLDFFLRIVATFQSAKVIDIGCGGGILTESLARARPEFDIIGFDISPKSIKIAKKHAKENKVVNVRYKVGSAYHLPISDESVDIIVMSDILEHLNDLSTVFKEINRVLKKGGVFVYDTVNRTLFSWLVVIRFSEKLTNLVPNHIHDWRLFITPEEMKYGLQRVGLKPSNYIRGIELNLGLSMFKKCLEFLLGKRNLNSITEWKESDMISGSFMGYATK